MMERFDYEPDGSRIVFGPSRINQLAGETERRGLSRIAIVYTPGRRAAADRAAAALGTAHAGTSWSAATNLPRTAFETLMADLREFGADAQVRASSYPGADDLFGIGDAAGLADRRSGRGRRRDG